MNAEEVVDVFNGLFLADYRTRLLGGASEPLYRVNTDGSATIHFREDFVSSALHEVSHWCLAGPGRRRREDYGYWYVSDRGACAQRHFEVVESRPQALEWVFSVAAAVPFRVSVDNFRMGSDERRRLQTSVQAKANAIRARLPGRAAAFAAVLATRTGHDDFLAGYHYRDKPE